MVSGNNNNNNNNKHNNNNNSNNTTITTTTSTAQEMIVFLCSGLLAVQSSDGLLDVSGFRNMESVGALVIANMGNLLKDFDGFNSLFEASILIITRNQVSERVGVVTKHIAKGCGLLPRGVALLRDEVITRFFSVGDGDDFWLPRFAQPWDLPAHPQPKPRQHRWLLGTPAREGYQPLLEQQPPSLLHPGPALRQGVLDGECTRQCPIVSF